MINKLKKLFRNFLGTTVNRELIENSHRLEIRNLNEILALQHLERLNLNTFVVNTGWSSSYSMIHHVINDLIVYNRKNILEFGMGNSTLYISHAIKRLELNCGITSVDSNKEWIEIFKNQNTIFESESFISIVLAPIEQNTNGQWYSESSLNNQIPSSSKFDVIIIDGPSSTIHKNIRQNGVDYILKILSDNFIIFIDDVFRSEENDLIQIFKEKIPGISMLNFGRYAILYKKDCADAVPAYLWR